MQIQAIEIPQGKIHTLPWMKTQYLKAANKSNPDNQEAKEKNPKIWGILLPEPDNQKTHNTDTTIWKDLDDEDIRGVNDETRAPAHGNKKGPQDRIPEPLEITSHSDEVWTFEFLEPVFKKVTSVGLSSL